MTLSIQTSMLHVPVERDGEVTTTLHFDPKSPVFRAQFADLLDMVQNAGDTFAERCKGHEGDNRFVAKENIRLHEEIAAAIDKLFGIGTCEAAFGGIGHVELYAAFFEGLSAVVGDASKEAMSRYLPTKGDEDGFE